MEEEHMGNGFCIQIPERMFMKKFKKITAVLLSVVMLFSMASTSASAAYTAYLDDGILDQYNSIDKANLSIEQKASLVLDRLDNMLAKEEIVIDLPLIGTVDLTSTDKALDSICSVTGNWLFGSLTAFLFRLVNLLFYWVDGKWSERSADIFGVDLGFGTGNYRFLSKFATRRSFVSAIHGFFDVHPGCRNRCRYIKKRIIRNYGEKYWQHFVSIYGDRLA